VTHPGSCRLDSKELPDAPIDPYRSLALAVVGGTLALAAPAQAGSAPVLEFSSPPTPAFGTVAVGESSEERTFTVTNRGGKATGSLKVALTGTAFTIPAGGDLCTAVSLGPKKSCAVTVLYMPAAAGANDTATLTVSSKKPAASASLNLTGSSPTAVSPGCQYLQEHPNDFGVTDNFRAGDIISLTTPLTGGIIQLYVNNNMVSVTTSPTPATYTVPSDGSYLLFFALEGDFWAWGCTPAA